MPVEMIQPTWRLDAYHVLPDSPQMQRDFLYVLASLSAKSSESWAQDVLRVAKINAILPVDVQGFQEYMGRGLGGLVTFPDEKRPRAVIMGHRQFMEESGLNVPAILEVTARKWEKEPGSQMLLTGWDGWVRGIVKLTSLSA